MSVQFDVSTLVKEPVGATREYDLDERVAIEGEAGRPHVTGRTTFLRTERGVLVRARLHGEQRDQCSRCLRDVSVGLAVAFDEEFMSTVDARAGAALPRPEDPEASLIDAHQTLDLTETVRQCWTAALPMQPLCRPDCKGLCPRCGADLNEGPCSCPPEEDERWSALRLLARKLEGT